MVKYSRQIERKLKNVDKDREKYLLATTGHQGEPKAVLSRITRGELDFKFDHGDIVVFSCQVIPVEINIQNRERLENFGVTMENAEKDNFIPVIEVPVEPEDPDG